jgi:hypothetical protein
LGGEVSRDQAVEDDATTLFKASIKTIWEFSQILVADERLL